MATLNTSVIVNVSPMQQLCGWKYISEGAVKTGHQNEVVEEEKQPRVYTTGQLHGRLISDGQTKPYEALLLAFHLCSKQFQLWDQQMALCDVQCDAITIAAQTEMNIYESKDCVRDRTERKLYWYLSWLSFLVN